MAEIGYAITANLIDVIGSDIIQNICKLWNYQSQLEKLQQTVSAIQQVFLDADAKWDQLSNQDRDFIRKLKDVVYDAEDVFDEFRTRAELNQLGKRSMVRKFFGKVRGIFSSDVNHNKVYYAHRVSRDVMNIKERLDAIAADHKLFELKFDYKPIVCRPKETCSYIDASKIIGRDKDMELIIDMLFDPNVQAVTVVGMGGLGKTALAQLVFNDEKIKREFLNNRFWVCVSDQEGEQFDVKTILSKILELVTRGKVDGNSSLESVNKQFQEKLKENKYFLVLDDVWNEDRVKWDELENLLCGGQGESKIIVTTRSEQTARSIGKMRMHRLDGLSQEDSQCLFEMSAFGEGEKRNEFVRMGEKIMRKCHRNPLAIKVVGSLLFGQDLNRWESIERSGLTQISEGSDRIMSILKLSFNKLTPSLKSCFSYCAIFPKDFDMDKEMLIGLWMSQGYIVPFDRGQSVEDAAEEYFSILMKRCFFQDVKKDKYGNVISVKIHDLMHDVAQEVGKEVISVVTSDTNNLRKTIRHVNVIGDGISKISLSCSRIRSYICRHNKVHMMDKTVENWTTLRVLDLSQSSIGSLLDSIDSLLLLRYLNLSGNIVLTSFPDSITRLYNLQTLILRGCRNLKELPKHFCSLINLRHLDVYECKELIGLPLGIDKLTNLRMLPFFVAGSDDELKVLKVFTELQGSMHITIKCNYRHVDGVNDRGYLKDLKHLRNSSIKFDYCINPEGLMRKLEPPPNLKGLILDNYYGTSIPWSTISLQCLVDLQITDSWKLNQIPVLSKLPCLKSLKLKSLKELEYMENEMSISSSDTEATTAAEFFPSLEALHLHYLYKLKGWWNTELFGLVDGFRFRVRFPRLSYMSIHECHNLSSFAPCPSQELLPEYELPHLYELDIRRCPNLISNLVCPKLERLKLCDTSERLRITCGNSQDDVVKLREVLIDKVDHLKPLITNSLTELVIDGDSKVECFLEIEEKFQRCASSLRALDIRFCVNLRRLIGLEHLTALEELKLLRLDRLSIFGEDEDPWKSFHSLRKLEFHSLNIVSLPKGINYLTSLQTLVISYCPGIKSLPEEIKGLTSLKRLSISLCSELIRRCNKSNGEDFPKIQHIPHIDI